MSVRIAMETIKMNVKLTRKFQIIIPKGIREKLGLTPGEELLVDVFDNTIRLQRPRSIKRLRGIAKGMKWKDEDRDRSERF